MTDTERSWARRGAWMAIAAAVAFSFKAVFVKIALRDGADPIVLLGMRMILAAPFFALWLYRDRERVVTVTKADAARVSLLGLLGFYAAAVLDFLGLQYLTAGLERIVLYVHPTFVLVFGAVLQRRWPTARSLAAVGVAWAGLVLAAGADARAGSGDVAFGTALVLGSAVLYAAYLLGIQRLGETYGNLNIAAAANLVASLALAAHVITLHPGALAEATASLWQIALVMALVSTVLPHLLLAEAIARVGPGMASTLGMVGPFAASLLGWALLAEPLSATQLAGGAVVIAGVSMSRRG